MDIKIKKSIDVLTGRADEDAANKKELKKSRWEYIAEIVKVAIVAILIVVPVRYFFIQPFVVSGASMQPQFYNREYLIIDEFTYRRDEPQRGDVIVFRYPKEPSQFYIKRIIGLPGETVEIKNGKTEIFNSENPWGLILDEPYLNENDVTHGDMSVKIDSNNFFVMGDNRQASSDSRIWGTVDKKYIIGRVWLRAWPPDRAQAFSEQINY